MSPYQQGCSESDNVVTNGDFNAVCSVLKAALTEQITTAFTALKDVNKTVTQPDAINSGNKQTAPPEANTRSLLSSSRVPFF